MGKKGDVIYMRGIAGHPADTDRDTGFKKALAEYPDIKVAKEVVTKWDPATAVSQINDIMSSGVPFDGVWTSGVDSSIVEAMKTAGHELVPLVGADNAGFVTQLLNEPNFTGAAVTNPSAVTGAGVVLALQLLAGESRPRPPSTSPRSSGTTRRTRARHPWRPPRTRTCRSCGPSGSRSRTGPRTAWTTSSPARARASRPGSRQETTRGDAGAAGAPAHSHRRSTVERLMPDLLLEATGVAKRYGAVAALRDASLSVRAGEVHALMGANGAGKSTLVKILTGAVHPDSGTITVRGEPYAARSPAEARQAASSRSTRSRPSSRTSTSGPTFA